MPSGGERPKCSVEGCCNDNLMYGYCRSCWGRISNTPLSKLTDHCGLKPCEVCNERLGHLNIAEKIVCCRCYSRHRRNGSFFVIPKKIHPIGREFTDSKGIVRIRVAEGNPFRNKKNGYARKHAVVMNEVFGCFDSHDKFEMINGDKQDCSPSNIRVIKSKRIIACCVCKKTIQILLSQISRAKNGITCSRECNQKRQAAWSKRRFSNSTAYEIRCVIACGMPLRAIARRLKVDRCSITNIALGKTYKDVPFPTFLENRKMSTAAIQSRKSSASAKPRKSSELRSAESVEITTTQRHKRVRERSQKAARDLFEFAEDFYFIMKDEAYLDAAWKGVVDARYEELQKISGNIGWRLDELVQMFNFASTRERWDEISKNGTRLDILRDEASKSLRKKPNANSGGESQPDAPAKRHGPVPVKEHEKIVGDLSSQIRVMTVEIDRKQAIVDRVTSLEEENARLKEELEKEKKAHDADVNRLLGRIEELEKRDAQREERESRKLSAVA